MLSLSRIARLWALVSIVYGISGHLQVTAAAASDGQISVSPGNLDFPAVVLGYTETLSFRIQNTSPNTLSLYRVNSSNDQFKISGPPLPISLAPTERAEFQIQFQPEVVGKTSALLEIVTSAQAMITYTLTGFGKESHPAIELSTTALDFGSQSLYSHSAKLITVRNKGDAPVTIQGLTVTGAGFGAQKFPSGRSLAPGQEAVLQVSFKPLFAGAASGELSILHNGSGSRASVLLAGGGVSNPRSTATTTSAVSSASSSTAAASPGQTGVNLTWSASSTPVVGYRVYRGFVSGGPYAVAAPNLVAALNYTDAGVSAGSTYYYVVTSVDANGVESAYSNEAVVTIPSAAVPAAPSPPVSLPSTAVPSDPVTGMVLNGSATLDGNRLRLTSSNQYLVGSAYYATPVSVRTFTNDFTFQLTNTTSNPLGNGITFVMQNAGSSALGPLGGGLGYGPDNISGLSDYSNMPIGQSVAVKFDLVNNEGEGNNSTGIYVNGASPTVPAVTLGGGVDLHSGDVFQVHMSYDGTTLAMTITDTSNTTEIFTASWLIDIPGSVGGKTAYVGFTGATGWSVANQDILTWSYNPASTAPTTNPAPPTTNPVPTMPIVYQTALLPAASSGPTFRTFGFSGFPDATGTILDAASVGDNVTFTVNVPAAGTYDIQLSYKQHNTRGISQFSIGGTNLGAPLDQYLANDQYAVVDYGTFTFPSSGNYFFTFTVVGKNWASSGYSISFDDLSLIPQP